jgi:hypothetical protein
VDAIDPIVRTQRQGDPRRADPISPRDLRKILPFEPAAPSAWLGWPDLAAVPFRATPAFEFDDTVPTHHSLIPRWRRARPPLWNVPPRAERADDCRRMT